ncbi:M16 family metallopeptidase [Candidatus Riflebacteria bacterium]
MLISNLTLKISVIFCIWAIIFFPVTLESSMKEQDTKIFSFKLDNGLKVLYAIDRSSAEVHIISLIKAGALYEERKNKGVSHFLEHLLINRKSKNYASGVMARKIKNSSGYINGHTGFDYTTYEISLPREKLLDGLKYQREILFYGNFDALDVSIEQKAILEERRRNLDNPKRVIREKLRTLLFKPTHPYCKPVIGNEEDIGKLDRETIFDYYKSLYFPANMCLVITGDIQADKLKKQIKEIFSPLIKKNKKNLTSKPFFSSATENGRQKIPILVEKGNFSSSFLGLAFLAPAVDNRETFTIDLLSYTLAKGENSILHSSLVREKSLAKKVVCQYTTPALPGPFFIQIEFANKNPEKLLKEVLAQLINFNSEKFSALDFKRIKNKFLTELFYANSDALSQALGLAIFESKKQHPFYENYPENIESIEYKEFLAVARKYLNPSRFAVYLNHSSEAMETKISVEKIEKIIEQQRQFISSSKTEGSNGNTLPGLHCITIEGSRVSSLVLLSGAGIISDGKFPGISQLMLKLLFRGNQRWDSKEMEGWMNQYRIKASFNTYKDQSHIILQSPVENTAKIFELARELLSSPTFSSRDIEQLKKELIFKNRSLENDSKKFVLQKLHNLIFDEHPYAQTGSGSEVSFKKLTRSHIQSHFKKYYQPQNLIFTYCGPMKSSELKPWFAPILEENTATDLLKVEQKLHVPLLKPGKKLDITKDIAQAFSCIGWQIPEKFLRNDLPGLLLLNEILGQSSGSRLWVIRQKYGLVYFIRSMVLPYRYGGILAISLGTAQKNLTGVLKTVKKQISNLVSQPISKMELQNAKERLLGRLLRQRRRTAQKAYYNAMHIFWGRKPDFDSSLPELIKKLNSAVINRLATDIFKENNFNLVRLIPESK